jgi:hypothetical protein
MSESTFKMLVSKGNLSFFKITDTGKIILKGFRWVSG